VKSAVGEFRFVSTLEPHFGIFLFDSSVHFRERSIFQDTSIFIPQFQQPRKISSPPPPFSTFHHIFSLRMKKLRFSISEDYSVFTLQIYVLLPCSAFHPTYSAITLASEEYLLLGYDAV
jgi:hypothetical protein